MASSSRDVAQWSDAAVKACLTAHEAKSSEYTTAALEIVEALGNLAQLLNDAGKEEKLAQVRAAAEKLSQSRRKMQLQHDALQSLGGPGGYAASGASTDFGGTLASRRAALAEQNQEEDEVMTRFEELAKFTEEDEQIDDGIAIAGGSGLDLAKNSKCPITLKDILALDEPVKDTVGYVYEKSAITHHIKASGGRAVCPVAGTSHTITLAEMRPAAAVIAAQRRAAGGKGQANKGKAPPIEL